MADRNLRALPTPRAPHTLLPRIMAAVHQWASRPWYSRAWFTWPAELKLASLIALVLLVFGGALAVPWIEEAAAPVVVPVAVLWRAVLEPLVRYAAVLVAVMCVACGAFGLALNQVVLGRAFSR